MESVFQATELVGTLRWYYIIRLINTDNDAIICSLICKINRQGFYLHIYWFWKFDKFVLCRTTLGFWAGHRNSKIRVILARVWENDTELDISNNRISRATGHLVYQKRFYRSKFCICPGGSQVNSARIADSIHYGCIPGKIIRFNDIFPLWFHCCILSLLKLYTYMTVQVYINCILIA